MPTRHRGRSDAGISAGAGPGMESVLLIDLPADMTAALPDLAETTTLSAHFDEVDIDYIARHDPQVVFAPLVGPRFDILDVGAKLLRCGFTGQLRALSGPLPNLGSVRSELRHHCVGLDVDIVVLTPPAATGH